MGAAGLGYEDTRVRADDLYVLLGVAHRDINLVGHVPGRESGKGRNKRDVPVRR